jgi:hypothetical protein
MRQTLQPAEDSAALRQQEGERGERGRGQADHRPGRQCIGAPVQHQQHETKRGEGELAQQLEGQVDDRGGAGGAGTDAVERHDPDGQQLAADRDDLADAGAPKPHPDHQQGRPAGRGLEQRAPREATDRDRERIEERDGEHAHDAGRNHRGGDLIGAGPDDQRRAEREAGEERERGSEPHECAPDSRTGASAASATGARALPERSPKVASTAPHRSTAALISGSTSAASSASGR